MPVPDKGSIRPIDRKPKSFVERLIKGKEDAVAGYQLLSKVNAASGETYVSDRCRNSNKGERVPERVSCTVAPFHESTASHILLPRASRFTIPKFGIRKRTPLQASVKPHKTENYEHTLPDNV
jgi:hypothetical protein